MKDIAIHTETLNQYDQLMKYFDSIGVEWCDGEKATSVTVWHIYGDNTCIILNDNLTHGHKNNRPYYISFDEYMSDKQGVIKPKTMKTIKEQKQFFITGLDILGQIEVTMRGRDIFKNLMSASENSGKMKPNIDSINKELDELNAKYWKHIDTFHKVNDLLKGIDRNDQVNDVFKEIINVL